MGRICMNQTDLNLEQLERRLSELSPAKPSADLAHRLEMTIHQAEEELAHPANIIHHPFAQWAVAAAALFVALLMAVQTTRDAASLADEGDLAAAPVSVAPVEDDIRPIYQIINGELVPVAGTPALQQASYRGMRVINGKAYRDYRQGEKVFIQPVLEPDAK